MAKRRKKTAGSGRITVSKAALNKVISAGAGHHASLKALKATVRAAPKKTTKKRATKKRATKKRARKR